ncbi:MAG: rRNA pseudouridine synthase [Parcubacteria group bacterium]|nr:rRNA pseudouridine synthase [Parcubacteria group bacterium]
MAGIVLQKALADAGVASRRSAEKLIAEGRVRVNGSVVRKLGTRVDLGRDAITLDGKRLAQPSRFVYFLLNKPAGVVSTVSDERGRETVLDLVPSRARVVPVGRLDVNTTGLLILTNDGDLVYELTHPKFEHEKEYEAVVQIPQDWDKDRFKSARGRMRHGLRIAGGFRTSPAKIAVLEQVTNDRYLISITIHEGRKHQVRRMIDSVGMSVVSLKRVRMGPIKLGDLPEGECRELADQEIRALKK